MNPSGKKPVSLSELIQKGIFHYQAGNLDEANKLFQTVLHEYPQHPDALHMSGAIAHQMGNHKEAVGLIEQALKINTTEANIFNNCGEAYRALHQYDLAIERYKQALEINPDYANSHYNLGLTFQTLKREEEALSHFKQTLVINPGHVKACNNLGAILLKLDRTDEAITLFKRAIEINPKYYKAHNNLGCAYSHEQHDEAAVPCFEQALTIDPSYTEAHLNLGISLRKLNRTQQAVTCFEELLRLKPGHAKALYNLGDSFKKQGHIEQAITCFERALAVTPEYAEALRSLGDAHTELSQIEQAILLYEQALRINPDYVEAHINLGVALAELGRHEEAMACYQEALALDPDFAEGHNNLGAILQHLGRIDEAISSFEKAVAIQPDFAGAHNNLGMAYLSVGNFPKGLAEHEWRWQADELPFTPRPCTQPLWDGSSLRDKTILVWGEQGVGDKIMYSRFLPMLAEQSAHCIVECEPRLIPIFQRSFPTVEVVESTQPLAPSQLSSEIDFQIAMGGLMQWLISYKNGQPVIPSTSDYIAANRKLAEEYRQKYCDSEARLLVGVSWFSGNPYVGKYRTTTLDMWAKLLAQPGIRFVSLQYGDVKDEIASVNERYSVSLFHDERVDPLEDLDRFAAQVAAMDLVISIDNSTVHMAGALGIPVWTLLPFSPDWRWALESEETLWYAAMRLFRQTNLGDWEPVFARVIAELQKEQHDSSQEKQKYERVWEYAPYRNYSPGLEAYDRFDLVSLFRAKGVKTIMDAGCGTGKLLKKLIQENGEEFSYQGFDIAENCLDPYFDEIKNSLLTLGCLWDANDFKQPYDAIICTDVLEHIPTRHISAVLKNLHDNTRKFCYLAIALFPDNFGNVILNEPLHLTMKEPAWWIKHVKKAGFKIDLHQIDKNEAGRQMWLHLQLTP